MYCKNNYSDQEFTLPLNLGVQVEDQGSRSPKYDSFHQGKTGDYHILVISETPNTKERKLILLENSTYSIGRHKANSITLKSNSASRHHAYLLRIPDLQKGRHYYRIFDGDFNGKRSRNGLWINGKRRWTHTLENHDVISFGEEFTIEYHIVSNRYDARLASAYPVEELPNPFLQSELIPDDSIFPKSTHVGPEASNKDPAGVELSGANEAELARLSSFAELAPNAIIETDLNGAITYFNPIAAIQFQALELGHTSTVTEGLFSQLNHGKAQKLVREIQAKGCIYEQSVYCILQSKIIRSYFTEITQRKTLEQDLYETKSRYVAAVNGANDGIWDWNLIDDTIYFSQRWKSMLGCEADEIGQNPSDWLSRIHPHDRDRVNHELNLHLDNHVPHFESEYRILHKDGSYRWVRVRGLAVKNEQHQPVRIAGSQADIHEHYTTREQLAYEALHDAMTGLPNRTLFMDRLSQAIKGLKRNPSSMCAVLFLDLDRFKLINDSLGHFAGDELLIEAAKRIKNCLRSEDTVARLGGDEFVVLLNSIDQVEDAVNTANKVLRILRLPIYIKGHEILTSASIGIAISESDSQPPEELLQNADAAMYQAKHLGKNQYAFFGNNLRGDSFQKLTLERDLQRAIQRQEFHLEYQPIMDLGTDRLIGFEALLRWHHPKRGLVSPADFIPLAEDTGQIIPIGWWVLETACAQIHQWEQQYPQFTHLSMSVNISSRQFMQPDFIENISQIVAKNQIKDSQLKLEITEGVAMHDPQTVSDKFKQLQTLGLRLMMDDFGTGYSSLNYLKSFAINTLKIDRSFVDSMLEADGMEIVKTIINLAHNLRMDVVAEGVEHQEQATRLTELGCEYAQGYFFARPLTVNAVAELLGEAR